MAVDLEPRVGLDLIALLELWHCGGSYVIRRTSRSRKLSFHEPCKTLQNTGVSTSRSNPLIPSSWCVTQTPTTKSGQMTTSTPELRPYTYTAGARCLSQEQMIEIRELASQGTKRITLAERYKVSLSTINQVVRGKPIKRTYWAAPQGSATRAPRQSTDDSEPTVTLGGAQDLQELSRKLRALAAEVDSLRVQALAMAGGAR